MITGARAAPPFESGELDAGWDRLLEGHPLGCFQQTSRWARVKAHEGWTAERVYLVAGQPERGGVQLLWKSSRFGRLGYVSKGPVIPGEAEGEVDEILGRLERRLRELRLRAIVLQPPDGSRITVGQLERRGFGRRMIPSVSRATAQIDLSGSHDDLLARMARNARRQARQLAEKAPESQMTIRLGGREDLGVFFELMLASCRRQQVMPNPARVELLEALWDAFHPAVRVVFASVQGQPVSAALLLGHGSRLVGWKKGWNSAFPQLDVNFFLIYEVLKLAREWGYRTLDVAAMDPAIAETLLSGRELSTEQQRSRDMFHLRLGAKPQLLPPAQLYVVNPVLRGLFRWAGKWPALETAILARAGGGG
jgi:lipid II:glycine glycyltransferase (peptidoglycan interpeptide bridge formation enzyme)